MALEAVIFDMDGVLTDTVGYHFRSWKKVCEELDIPFTYEDNDKLLGLTRMASLDVILNGRVLPETEREEILQRKNAYFREMIEEMSENDLLPGVEELVRELHQADVLIGVASASRNADYILKRVGISPYLSVLIDGKQIKQSKPYPEAYLMAVSGLSREPQNCMAVEDSSAGVEAALDAGICLVGVGRPQLVGHAHAVFPDLSHIHIDDLEAVHRWWSASHSTISLDLFSDVLQTDE